MRRTIHRGQGGQPGDWLAEAERLFEARRYEAAVRFLETAIRWRSPQPEEFPRFGDSDRRRAWYLLGLSRALQGRREEALAAMRAATNTAGVEAMEPATIAGRAERFLAAANQPPGLSGALAAVGQLFRALDIAQHESGPGATTRCL